MAFDLGIVVTGRHYDTIVYNVSNWGYSSGTITIKLCKDNATNVKNTSQYYIDAYDGDTAGFISGKTFPVTGSDYPYILIATFEGGQGDGYGTGEHRVTVYLTGNGIYSTYYSWDLTPHSVTQQSLTDITSSVKIPQPPDVYGTPTYSDWSWVAGTDIWYNQYVKNADLNNSSSPDNLTWKADTHIQNWTQKRTRTKKTPVTHYNWCLISGCKDTNFRSLLDTTTIAVGDFGHLRVRWNNEDRYYFYVRPSDTGSQVYYDEVTEEDTEPRSYNNYTLPSTTKTGWTLTNYTATSWGQAVSEAPGTTISAWGTYGYQNLTWTPHYRWNNYPVKFHNNIEGVEDTVLSQTYTYNDIHIAPAKPDGTAWTWEGHIFSGWGRADTVEWLPGQIIPELTTTDGETVNVYAIWLDYYNVALGYDSNTIKSATKTAGHYSDGNPNHYNYHEQITFTATLKDDETYPNDYQHPGYKYTFKRWMFSHTDLGKGTISGRTSTLVLTTGEDPLTIGGEVRVYGNKYDKHYYFVYSDYGTAKITSGGTTKENEMILVSKYTGTAYDTYAGDEFSVSVDIDSNFYVDHWERRTESGSYEIIPNSSTTTLSGLHADEYTRYRAIVKVDGQAVYILAPDDLDNFQVISQPVRIVNGMPEANNTIFIGKEYPDDYATANPNGKIAKAKIGDFFLMAKEEE